MPCALGSYFFDDHAAGDEVAHIVFIFNHSQRQFLAQQLRVYILVRVNDVPQQAEYCRKIQMRRRCEMSCTSGKGKPNSSFLGSGSKIFFNCVNLALESLRE